MIKKRSELQKSILLLYRNWLKFGCSKPEPLRSSIINYAYKTFRDNRNIPRVKFDRIEYFLRQETNKLNAWKEANLTNVSKFGGKK